MSSLLALAAFATSLSPRAQLLRLVPRSGFAAPAQATEIDAAARALEESAEAPGFPRDLMEIEGRWRLLYTSSPALALPAGLPPPFDLASSPLAPRAVEQRIDVMGRRVVNCVTLRPWPGGDENGFTNAIGDALRGLPGVGAAIGALEGAEIELELDHAFTVDGDGADGGAKRAAGTSTVRLELEEVRRNLAGAGDGLPAALPRETSYKLGPLSAVSSLGSAGEFSTTFVDAGLRISRGGWPLEELRVFEKVVNCFDGEDADECELEGIGQTGAEESEVDWTSMSLADEDIPDG